MKGILMNMTALRNRLRQNTIWCAILAAIVVPSVAFAADPLSTSCSVGSGAPICEAATNSKALFGTGSYWTNLINTMILVIGTVSVLMVVIGGLRYTISGGEPTQIKSAKDTILYAIIGVVIAIISYAILNFVVVNIIK